MKRALVAFFLSLSMASTAVTQTEMVTLFADAAGTDCSIAYSGPGVVEVHIFHVGPIERAAVAFRAPKPDCWTGAAWLGDIGAPGVLTLGTTQTDFEAAYGCRELPFRIGLMNYFVAGAAQPCCEYPVLRNTNYPAVVSVDCTQPFGQLIQIEGGKATINENATCLCDPPLAVEESTWGRVKALYR